MYTPRHVAIIQDGNRTWAKNRGLPVMDGHLEGAKNAIELIKYVFTHTTIEVITGRFLSTENLENRSQQELGFIFGIYKLIGNDLDEFMRERKVNFRWVGKREGIPQDFLDFLDTKQREFTFDSDKTVVFTLNYGGRDEIIRGIHKLASDNKDLSKITIDDLSGVLDFAGLPVVDLVIRTKGNLAQRTSDFMARRIGYAELYFTDVLYPDFNGEEFEKALKWFDKVYEFRNFGK